MCQIQIIEHDCKSAADYEHDLIQAALSASFVVNKRDIASVQAINRFYDQVILRWLMKKVREQVARHQT